MSRKPRTRKSFPVVVSHVAPRPVSPDRRRQVFFPDSVAVSGRRESDRSAA